MDKKLLAQAILKYTSGVLLTGLLLFLPAGTIHYPGGWVLMGILFLPMFLGGLVLWRKNPELLRKRLQAKETETEQKRVIAWGGLQFLAGFLLAGCSYRFGWLLLPVWVQISGTILFLGSYALYAEVLRENTYLSRTIEVQENQKVVDTGLYGLVRHPMYAVTVLLFLSIPLVLGSLLSFLVFLPYPFLLVRRIRNEEKVLTEQLDGYAEYRKKVRYRLFPFLW